VDAEDRGGRQDAGVLGLHWRRAGLGDGVEDAEGETVSFDVEQGPEGPQAVNVVRG
jgi:hypothetical protein